VAENAPTSTVIYTATATDASAVTYSLSGDDAALLNIDASTGVVTLKNSADFETKSSYSFTVTATDALGNASTPQSVIVNVTDVDEVAPVFTSGTTGSVVENAPTSTVIYTATATDASAVTYSLSGDDAALLNIDASTGVVTLKNSADFETKSSYSFTVTATDALGNASTPQSVIVNVTDVDEVAPVFTSGTTGSVVENAPTSTVIYTATATDASAVTYSLSGDDAALLNIDASTGVVTLKNSADFETKSSYSFTVTATDALGNASTPQSVIVNVTDVDEVAPVFTSGTTGSVAENAPTSTVIYTATATDASAVTYSLSGDDAALLNIDASTGVVTLKNSADFETKSSYSFTVTATDALGNASTPQSVTVGVTNVNEAPTAVTFSNTVTELTENTVIGAGIKLADIAITDDALGTNTLSLDGVDKDSFEIRGNALYYIGASPDFETKSSYAVTVVATDAALNASVSQNFTLGVTDVNEVPIDTTPPDAPTIAQVAGDDRVNNTEKTAGITISGTAEANSAVSVTWGTTALTTTADANGNWSRAFTNAQIPADGNTTISVTATDAAGNTSEAGTRSVLIDTVAPIAPTITLSNDTGTSTSDRITNDASLNVTGEEGATLEYRIGNGNWSSTYTTPTADGSYTVQVRQTDLVGNVSSTGSISFTLDSTAPTNPTIGTIAGNNIINAAEAANGVVLSGSTEAGSSVNLDIAGLTRNATVTRQGNTTTWSYTLTNADITALGQGTGKTVTITSADAAGNTTSTTSQSFAIETRGSHCSSHHQHRWS
jgi:hypothetical protein